MAVDGERSSACAPTNSRNTIFVRNEVFVRQGFVQWRLLPMAFFRPTSSFRHASVVWRLSFVCAEPKRVTSMSDVARARGPAAHRRERRLRAFWRHEIMSVKMATNSANHHSAQRQTVLYVDTGTQTCTWTYMDSEEESLDDFLSGNESPAPVFTSAAPSPVTLRGAYTCCDLCRDRFVFSTRDSD